MSAQERARHPLAAPLSNLAAVPSPAGHSHSWFRLIEMTTSPSNRDRPFGQTSGSEQRSARRLTGPALDFDLDAELASLRQEPSFERGDRNGRTLVEETGFRVTLTALKAGTVISEHHTAGWVSIQTTAGHLRIKLADRTVDLPAGRLLILAQNVPHDVEALEESALLIAIALPDRTAP
jgi:quercetin dioxygenase-like cupin family protein